MRINFSCKSIKEGGEQIGSQQILKIGIEYKENDF